MIPEKPNSGDAIFVQINKDGLYVAQPGLIYAPLPDPALATIMFTDLNECLAYYKQEARSTDNGIKLELNVDTHAEKEIADEYHTMAELYDYRMVYHAHTVLFWTIMGYPIVKSKRHHDGELCFDGEYFIVSAKLPTGQVSNHYKLEHWDLFYVEEAEFAPEWDGHTPEIGLNRLYNYITGEHFLDGERTDEREDNLEVSTGDRPDSGGSSEDSSPEEGVPAQDRG